VIYSDESFRTVLKALRAGKIVGILADQNLKALNGIFVDFFGMPTYTSTAPVNLAISAGTDMTYILLVREGGKYRVIHRVIEVSRTGQRDKDLHETTQRWTRFLEEDIRSHLDQWVWFHRRWRTRPEDGPRRVSRLKRMRGSGKSVES
jgi:KDO2-lipid IV(A) lauroyltransferase